MRNPYKLYKAQQLAQYEWIRKHPVQYVTLNVTLLALFIGYINYKDRRYARELDQEIANTPIEQ